MGRTGVRTLQSIQTDSLGKPWTVPIPCGLSWNKTLNLSIITIIIGVPTDRPEFCKKLPDQHASWMKHLWGLVQQETESWSGDSLSMIWRKILSTNRSVINSYLSLHIGCVTEIQDFMNLCFYEIWGIHFEPFQGMNWAGWYLLVERGRMRAV